MIRNRRHTLSTVLLGAIIVSGPHAAHAVDVLGMQLFGSNAKVPEGTIAYTTAFHVLGGDGDLEKELRASSILESKEKEGVADLFSLASRARADHERLIAALYADARYGATIAIKVAGQPLDALRDEKIDVPAGQSLVVDLEIDPGARFQFGQIIFDQSGPTDVAPVMEPAHYGLRSGEPAQSTQIITAIDKVREAWREHGYPLARIVRKDISADHARAAVDLHVTIDPGPPAVYGWVNVTGASGLSTGTIADQSALRPGRRYDARDLRTARERLRKLESIESVRVVEGSRVDEAGGIPMTLEVTERKPRYFGATA